MANARNAALLGITLALTLSGIVRAEEACPTVRFDLTDADVREAPLWSQGENSACAAYSASLLATLWIRKNLPTASTASKSFSADPIHSEEALLADPDSARYLDAENGRTCMAGEWIFREKSISTPPICEMFGLIRQSNTQELRTPLEFRKKMNALLTLPNASPFAIEFCAGTLYSPGPLIHKRTFRKTLTYLNHTENNENLENFDVGCFFHVAVVVGQELRNGKCQLRIRDTINHADPARGLEGDSGYIWVDAERVSENTLRTVAFPLPTRNPIR